MLDEFRSTSITWDKATRRIYSPITANASDSNGRKLNIQVVNSGQVENLTGATLHLYWETKDKTQHGLDAFTASDISKGEFEIFYTTGMLSNVGELNATLVLVDATGKVVSDWFKITVTRGIDDDAIQSENSFTTLTQALIDISNLEQNYAPRLNDLTAQLQQKSQGIYNISEFGAVGDGVTDDTNAILAAVAKANNEGGVVVIPNGRFKYTSTIVLHEGARMVGLSLPSTWTTKNRGSILEYHGDSVGVQYGDPTDIGGISNGGLSNFQVVDVLKTGTIGVLIGGTTEKWVHDVKMSQVMVDYFNVGFEICKSYGINADSCVSNRPRVSGWHLPAQSGSLTTSTFTNCGGYNSLGNGWVVGRAITYSSFDNCYFDGSEIAFYMTGYTNNQNFLNNFGAENYRSGGIEINSPSFLGGINSPILVNTKLKDDGDNIRANVSRLYLSGWYNSSSYSPSLGYDLNMVGGFAYLTNCTFNKLNGDYTGDSYGPGKLNKKGGPDFLNTVRINNTGSTTLQSNVSGARNIIGKTSNVGVRTIFNGGNVGQVIDIYGVSDTEKFFLDKYDFPKFENSLSIGKGDHVKMVYMDLIDGLGWYVIENNISS